MTSKEEKLNEPLDDLDDVQGIKGAAVVRRDGLLIASNLGQDIYDDKVKKIMNRTTKSNVRNMKPLIVSKDNFIVDGHHRWKALLIKFNTTKIPYIKIGLPAKRAVQMYNYVADKI